MRRILIFPFIFLIYIYKYTISPILPKGCRHLPSCSTYSIDALRMHGLLKGGLLAADRITRCHPWGTSGYDPVPQLIIKKINLRKLNPGNHRHYPACNRLKDHQS